MYWTTDQVRIKLAGLWGPYAVICALHTWRRKKPPGSWIYLGIPFLMFVGTLSLWTDIVILGGDPRIVASVLSVFFLGFVASVVVALPLFLIDYITVNPKTSRNDMVSFVVSLGKALVAYIIFNCVAYSILH
jgi:hypothetical protein